MMMKLIRFLLAACLCSGNLFAQTSTDYSSLVNTTVGWEGKGFGMHERYLEAGYTFPGAMYPFGMVQFTPTFFNNEKGFVVNQMSGAGCDHMANFPTLPLTGQLTVSPDSMLHLDPVYKVENATAGLFRVKVNEQVDASLTVTARTGMASYLYSKAVHTGTIVIGSGINGTRVAEAFIRITAPNRCEGYADGGSFCGSPANYKVYFVAEFDRDATLTGTWKNKELRKGADTVGGAVSGAWFSFDLSNNPLLRYKFAISYVSLENARQNLAAENKGWDFDALVKQNKKAWNNYLGRIDARGGSADYTSQFYTHLYHALAHPNISNDVNGDYTGADYKVHRLTGRNNYTGYSNWDTYRTQGQLLALLAPEEAGDMMESLVRFAQEAGGGFPRWVIASTETGIMQGDPTAVLLANAWAFGAKNFNAKEALRIMRLGAEQPGIKCQQHLTRPGLEDYLQKGYTSASISLEYASADFAIGQFARQALKNEPLYRQYLLRSQSWKHLFNPARNWLQSRHADGSWKRYDEDWRESSYKNYFWMVPHNLAKLIDTIGGKPAAEQRLDSFFLKLNASYSQEWFAAGNEPDFQAPWIYNWTNAPYKTNEVIRRIVKEQYANRINGLPGNDDMGAMGAWYVWAGIGLYPMIPGYGGFSISSPLFPEIRLQLNGKTVTIKGGSAVNPYISNLRVNGKPWDKTWIGLSELKGTLEYRLSAVPDKSWGTRTVPPSFDK